MLHPNLPVPSLLSLARRCKRPILLTIDGAAVGFAVLMEAVGPDGTGNGSAIGALALAMAAAAALVAFSVGADRIKLSVLDGRAAAQVLTFAILAALMSMIGLAALQVPAPIPAGARIVAFAFLVSMAARVAGHHAAMQLRKERSGSIPVAIYGAGSAGVQLLAALKQATLMHPVAIVDDNSNLHGTIIGGITVSHPRCLQEFARRGDIGRVLLAIPSLSPDRRAQILRQLKPLPCEIFSLPSVNGLIRSCSIAETLRPVSPEDLLGRTRVDLADARVAAAYAGRSVMVTGAGGSIGSELCRQILNCGPRRLCLFEQSEFNLYQVERQLRPTAEAAGVELVPILDTVTDEIAVERAIRNHQVDTILHAAAYKHVPMVEANAVAGARNNVLGTRNVAMQAARAGVDRFILVSTDKAVRPTNIMGATKRMAEYVIQDLQKRSPATRFAMVRFGNVLGSSGSVIPLFQEQIAAGGPVTLTHPAVTRFFMSIEEAASLVLLAGAYAEGGELFVLDMGEEVRIADLARRMIELSGLTVRDADNPEGDIEIRTTGLRPGEKLSEELLTDRAGLLPTPHDKIFCARESCPSEIEIARMLHQISAAVARHDPAAIERLAAYWVAGFHRESAAGAG